jgi:hypothetical protein
MANRKLQTWFRMLLKQMSICWYGCHRLSFVRTQSKNCECIKRNTALGKPCTNVIRGCWGIAVRRIPKPTPAMLNKLTGTVHDCRKVLSGKVKSCCFPITQVNRQLLVIFGKHTYKTEKEIDVCRNRNVHGVITQRATISVVETSNLIHNIRNEIGHEDGWVVMSSLRFLLPGNYLV